MYIIFCTHGYTDETRQGINMGRMNEPVLNEEGTVQSKITANYIKQYFDIQTIYTSPLTRAIQTAEVMADIFDIPTLDINKDPLLTNVDDGQYTGLTIQEEDKLNAANPKLAELLKPHSSFLDYQLNSYVTAEAINKIVGSEEMNHVQSRLQKFMKKIKNNKTTKDILVITHHRVINIMLRDLYNTRHLPSDARIMEAKYFHMSVINMSNMELIVGQYNMYLQRLYMKPENK